MASWTPWLILLDVGMKDPKKVSKAINNLLVELNMVDSYRVKSKWGGFTWGKDNPQYVRSRLDHILVSKDLKDNLKESTVRAFYEFTDHKAVITAIDFNESSRGKGIIRANSSLLEIESIKLETIGNITRANLMSKDKNPHEKWNLIKKVIKETLINAGKRIAIRDNEMQECLLLEINCLESSLESYMSKENRSPSEEVRITKLRNTVDNLKTEFKKFEVKQMKKLLFKLKIKGINENEKPSKAFLNMISKKIWRLISHK